MNNPWDRLPRPNNQSTPDQIFLEVGRALTHWERLEYRLSLIYSQLVSPGTLSLPAINSFGVVSASSGRTAMVAEAAYSFAWTSDDLKTRLLDFLDRVAKFGARRNEIAHGAVAVVDRRNHLLLPAFYATRKFRIKGHPLPKAAYMYGHREVEHYRKWFVKLAEEADALEDELRALTIAT